MGISGLLQPHVRDNPEQRDKHRGMGVQRLLRPHVRDDPKQRDEYRGMGVPRLYRPRLYVQIASFTLAPLHEELAIAFP